MQEVFHSTAQSCLARAEGNQQQADYLYDCSYFQYYTRIMEYNVWADKKAEAIKNANK